MHRDAAHVIERAAHVIERGDVMDVFPVSPQDNM